MNYASHTRRPNPAALIGALGIPAGFAALLVVGLAVKVVIAPEDPGLEGFTLEPIPIPPPPPVPTDPVASEKTPQAPASPSTPARPADIPIDFRGSTPIETLPGLGEVTGPVIGPVVVDLPGPAASPAVSPFAPVAAAPRGNPGRWVTDSDYRTRWINEGLTGTARFTLAIDAGGKVTGCTITRSTGHAALDIATCDLVTKRARFDPARDGNGKPVAGSYSSAINWMIPK